MEDTRAKRLAAEWVRLAEREKEDPLRIGAAYHGAERAEDAVRQQLVDMVPEDAIAAVVSDSGTSPAIAALANGLALHVVDFLPFSEQEKPLMISRGDARARWRGVRLDPALCSLTAESYLHRAHSETWRVTDWLLDVNHGTVALRFKTESRYGEDELDEGEGLARALCEALGAELPPRAPAAKAA